MVGGVVLIEGLAELAGDLLAEVVRSMCSFFS